jgi:cell division transport system permease protein
MALRTGYYFRETLHGLRRNGLIAFAAVSTAFIALFLVGSALLVSREVNLLIDLQTRNVEVSVFLQKTITPDQQKHLGQLLTSMPQVAHVTFESQSDAYHRFQEIFKNQKALAQNVSPDALPASFRVKLKNPEEFTIVASRLNGQPGIDKVVDNRETLRRLFAIIHLFRVGVFTVAIVMLLSAAALIGNTVRMAVFARRKEIGIMRLVGATNWHIRIPFMIEGVIEGLLGAGAAILGLFVLNLAFINPLRDQLGFMPLVGTPDVWYTVPWLLGLGVLVALFSSMFVMRRLLEV